MVIERTSSITNQLWQNCDVYIETGPKNIVEIVVDFIRAPGALQRGYQQTRLPADRPGYQQTDMAVFKSLT
jgi:hypothetical protein